MAFWASRVFVLAAGVVSALIFGFRHGDGADVGGLTQPFGRLGNLLVAGSARWDSSYYESIANLGYNASPNFPAFFPPYPLLIRALKGVPGSVLGSENGAAVVTGVIISLAAFFVALYLLHRLVTIDFGERVAGRTVTLTAIFPMAFFFSAVYTESLFLALSVGSVYAGRRGRWALAGVSGGLTAATRVTGLLVLIPLSIMLIYGPRGDRPSEPHRGWRPRYPPFSKEARWLLLVPLGLAAVSIYMWQAVGDALAPYHAQQLFNRHLSDPFTAIALGLQDTAWAGHRIVAGFNPLTDFATRSALTSFAFVSFAAVGVVGAVRRLPIAYSMYALAGLAIPFFSPAKTGREHWVSDARFIAVLFPIFIWLAIWTAKPSRWRITVGLSASLLALYTGLFATYHWVA
jgi:hypothetical protein